jgi:hypothetical protein
MGYDLRITRSTDWSRNAGHEIDSSEWLDLVGSDPELALDPDNGPYAVNWTSGWFDWFEGNIFTTNPTRATVAKMLRLAGLLSGGLQGDNGEFYESVSEWTAETLEARSAGSPQGKK